MESVATSIDEHGVDRCKSRPDTRKRERNALLQIVWALVANRETKTVRFSFLHWWGCSEKDQKRQREEERKKERKRDMKEEAQVSMHREYQISSWRHSIKRHCHSCSN